ncbi:hypothetical protein HO173_011114 [Letharia columbiana]|uniref:C2H2-type domain-containing protein n=1 Tax=Letharia columbiana TaxID=112416 RepID=A0A8H6FL99_9LECA|nr:uncharacterized protein HO173_011114 [Letharia columbiana]KAF6230577.1 hypothetical protein HO173_011114 [Letharia columbiana]
MSREDGVREAGLLDPPSFTTEEQDSYTCTNVDCLAQFETAVDLHAHYFTVHGKILADSREGSKDSDGSTTADSNVDEWPKAMILSTGLLAAGRYYDNNDDED